VARCWSCGAELPGGWEYAFTCPVCEQVHQIKDLRREASDNLKGLEQVQRRAFESLSDRMSEVASVIEWGFEEINWQLQQQTVVLRSIDHTLKTPSETQANEWRQMAEEMRDRGVLEQSEELFLKALDKNPLDYRTYIGLAQTYLRIGKFDEAKTLLEKSLPHAPLRTKREELKVARERVLQRNEASKWSNEKAEAFVAELKSRTNQKPTEELSDEEVDVLWEKYRPITSYGNYPLPFDYKSYTYRLIGHIYACEEDYYEARSNLKSAIDLSPQYTEGHYDYAQYCAILEEEPECLDSLQKALADKPLYFYLAEKEKNFDPLRDNIQTILLKLKEECVSEAEQAISVAEARLREAKDVLDQLTEFWQRKIVKTEYKSVLKFKSALEHIEKAQKRVNKTEKAVEKLEEKEYATILYNIGQDLSDVLSACFRYYDRNAESMLQKAMQSIERAIQLFEVSPYKEAKEACKQLLECRADCSESLRRAGLPRIGEQRTLSYPKLAEACSKGGIDWTKWYNPPSGSVGETITGGPLGSCTEQFVRAESIVAKAMDKVKSGDYLNILEAKRVAQECQELAIKAGRQALWEYVYYWHLLRHPAI
jgi:tetratricopeptide (TPR) repeat protein